MTSGDWRELAVAVGRNAGLDFVEIETLTTWDQKHRENALFRLDGRWMLKVYGPPRDWRYPTELAALRAFKARQAIPAPRVIAHGEPAGEAPYLVMTAVAGEEMADAWPRLTPDEQVTLALRLGEALAALHAIPEADLGILTRPIAGRDAKSVREEAAGHTAALVESAAGLRWDERDALLRFLHEQAPAFLAGPGALTHADLSHHHVYLAQDSGPWRLSGLIDWADAVVGPPEWDIVCLWHWTFNGVWQAGETHDWAAMRVCLDALFDGRRRPPRFARRCLAAHLHSPWFSLLWPDFLERKRHSNDVVRDLAAFLFAPAVFGPPD